MATIRPATIPTKRLASAITSAATTFQLTDILGWDGSALTSASFGTKAYGVFRDAANNHIELFEFDPSTIASSSISILLRGLKFDGDLTTEVSGNKRSWTKGALVELGTHVPQLFRHYVDTLEAQTIAGVKTFSSLPATTAGNPVADNDLVRKAYADAILSGGSGVPNRVVVAGNAGATVAAGNLVYLDVADGEWKLCDADTAATVDNIVLGLAQGAGTDGNPISNGVLLFGLDSNQTGLTTNTLYYASNTAGAISSTVGTTEVTVGVSRSTTSILFYPRYNQMLTEDQQDALGGTSGTPSNSNKFVTADDVSSAAASGKIVRASGTALPALDGSAVTGIMDKISMSTTPVTVSNTTTETNLISVSIPGGTLSTNNVVMARLLITGLNSDASHTMTLRLKYGATTIGATTAVPITLSSGNPIHGYIDVQLSANAATGAQKGALTFIGYADNSASTTHLITFGKNGTSSEDSTSDKNLVVSAQWGTAAAASSITMDSYVVYVVR